MEEKPLKKSKIRCSNCNSILHEIRIKNKEARYDLLRSDGYLEENYRWDEEEEEKKLCPHCYEELDESVLHQFNELIMENKEIKKSNKIEKLKGKFREDFDKKEKDYVKENL